MANVVHSITISCSIHSQSEVLMLSPWLLSFASHPEWTHLIKSKLNLNSCIIHEPSIRRRDLRRFTGFCTYINYIVRVFKKNIFWLTSYCWIIRIHSKHMLLSITLMINYVTNHKHCYWHEQREWRCFSSETKKLMISKQHWNISN